MIFGDILKGVFGDKGLTGSVLDVLKSTGILKDPAAIMQAEQALKALENDVARIETEDRASARRREIEVKDRTPARLAWVCICGYFVIMLIMMLYDIPAAAQNAMLIMLGTLTGIVTSIVNYYYGSSAGSAKKSDAIDRLMGQK